MCRYIKENGTRQILDHFSLIMDCQCMTFLQNPKNKENRYDEKNTTRK